MTLEPRVVINKFIDGLILTLWVILGCGVFMIALIVWCLYKGCTYIGLGCLKAIVYIKKLMIGL